MVCLTLCTRACARACWEWRSTSGSDLTRPFDEHVYVLLVRGCSWDRGGDLVSLQAGSGGGARRFADAGGGDDRRQCPAVQAVIVREARGVEWPETGGVEAAAAGTRACRDYAPIAVSVPESQLFV
jgi:hypothetical protein